MVSSLDDQVSASKITGMSSGEQLQTLHVKKLQFITLNRDNYVSWKAQATAVLRGTDLLKFVESDVDLTNGSILTRRDQLILGCLFSALS